MRRWGIAITVFYAVFVTFLIGPALVGTIKKISYWKSADSTLLILERLLETFVNLSSDWSWWLWVGMLIGGQALLLFLSVDTSRRMLRPRQHVAVTAGIAALLVALLTFAAIYSLAATSLGDDVFKQSLFPFDKQGEVQAWEVLGLLGGLWAIWGTVFYLYYRGSAQIVSTAVSWLLKGSVLELLVAVPAHIWVQRRDDCSAPLVTGFGIATGIAVMLLSFGPGVLALYAKKIEQYRAKRTRT